MTEVVLKITDLAFEVKQRRILQNISFSVGQGEFWVVLGPNGAGKTTLLKCLMRIERQFRGAVDVLGIPISRYRQRDLAKLIGYVPQNGPAALSFTVNEFVAMGRYPHLKPYATLTRRDRRAIEEAMTMTDVGGLAEQPLCTLSGGERQRVYIAAALAQGVSILLLDEPTAFLDPYHQEGVYRLISRLNRTLGLTVITVTHDINNGAIWGDRVLALRDGAVHFLGPGSDLMNNNVLSSLYDKSFVFSRHPRTGERCIVPDGKTQ